MTQEILMAGVGAVASWIWWVDKKVASHDAVIERMDKLVQLLLEDRLDQDQRRGYTQEPGNSGRYR